MLGSPARVAELADALDLGSSVFGRRGSSPLSRTAVKSRDIVHSMSRDFLCFGLSMCRVIVPFLGWVCRVIVPRCRCCILKLKHVQIRAHMEAICAFLSSYVP